MGYHGFNTSRAREVERIKPRVCDGTKGDEKIHGSDLTFLYVGRGSWSPSRSQISHAQCVWVRERERKHAREQKESRRRRKEIDNIETNAGKIKKQGKSKRMVI